MTDPAKDTPAPRSGKRSYKGRKRGPKTKWRATNPTKLAALAVALGATEVQVAAALDVTTQSFRNWKREKKQLFCAIESARADKDKRVEEAMFARATGYKHKAVKIMVVDGKVVKVPYTEQYAPDTQAGVYWLNNRASDRWRNRNDHTIANPDGSNVQGGTTVIAPTVIFTQPAKEQKQIGNGHDTNGATDV